MTMDEAKLKVLFDAALTVHEVTGDAMLAFPLMRCCSANGSREADGWLADFYLTKLDRTLPYNIDRWKLREACQFALSRGFKRLAMRCFEMCQPGELDDLKWGDVSCCPCLETGCRCQALEDVCRFRGDRYACCETYVSWSRL